ncbi:SLOG family protein [Anaerovorax odorimutans]|uniref:SLOG family protein n=1 Tax=Anaerovorax odorimutans TaxID=109327 RepID=UPI0003F51EE7|nr:SLOG family protein [Anaerovorax odorimutans]
MNNKENAICFSGHRSERLPQNKEQLRKLKEILWEEINKAILDGVDTFYFGACYGFDLLCADVVLKLKKDITYKDMKEITLIAVIPFEEQAKNWDEVNRDNYYDILSQCDKVITLNTCYRQGCYKDQNRYMVDRSSKMICYYDSSKRKTVYTVKYAELKNLQIINLYGN